MQVKLFTISLGTTIPIEDLYDTIVEVELVDNVTAGTHAGLVVSVANAALLNTLPIDGVPQVLQLFYITAPVIIVKIQHETDLNIDDITLEINRIYSYTRDDTVFMENNYKPLHNFYNGSGNIENDIHYNSPFTTPLLNLNTASTIDTELQFSYDSSINIIFTDETNPVRLVNSRWILGENGKTATIADRSSTKDTNTYSDENFYRVSLIPEYKSIPAVHFQGMFDGGILSAGGYRYYFRYLSADGAETDICEESRLVEVHKGDKPTNSVGDEAGNEPTNLYNLFELTNLDDSFYAIRVYYTISRGELNSSYQSFKISTPYVIKDGVCEIIHSGYEDIVAEDSAALGVVYSDISNARTVGASNNRLLIANTDVGDLYSREQAIKAASCSISESTFDIKHGVKVDSEQNQNYSNPLFTYDKLGYWRGETYELGVVFVSGKGESVVYPLHGIDNFAGDAVYNTNLVGDTSSAFYAEGENSLGVYRTKDSLTGMWSIDEDDVVFQGVNLRVKIDALLEGDDLQYTGFYFVRRIRKRDKIAQGILTPTAAIPTINSIYPETANASAGNWLGVGVTTDEFKDNITSVPAPNCLMPFGTESFSDNTDDPNDANVRVGLGRSADFVVKAPIMDYNDLKAWAFYSPDTDTAPVESATMFDGSRFGINVRGDSIRTSYENVKPEENYLIAKYQPYYLKLDGEFLDAENYSWKYPVEAQYAGTGAFNPGNRSFSAMMDRHLFIWQNNPVDANPDYAWYIDGDIGDDENVFNTGSDFASFKPAVKGVPRDAEPDLPPTGQEPLPKLDSYMQESHAPGSAVNYGRYVGIKIPNYEVGLGFLNVPATYKTEEQKTNVYTNRNYKHSLDTTAFTTDTTYSYGAIAELYYSTVASPISGRSWEQRYLADEDSPYRSISRRYSLDEYEVGAEDVYVDLYGGDCYLGLQWKQIWSPLGISEFPHVNNMDPFRPDRRALGLLNYGFAIPIPAQSNHNFNVRSKERFNDTEYNLLHKDRSYLPVKSLIRGDRLVETGKFNFGYDTSGQVAVNKFKLNSNTPYIKVSYPNRVYVSEPGVESAFWNGFTVFNGLNFKDYNSEYGSITRVYVLNNFTYFVLHHGVVQVGVNERSMISTDTGGIFTDNYDVLAIKSNVVSDKYGSQHLRSIVGSISTLYGVDAIKKKVWKLTQKGSSIISDFKVQSLVTSIIDNYQQQAADLDGVFDIYSTYDVLKNDILFTFTVADQDGISISSRTLVYNETLGIWVTETDDTRNFFFLSNEERYSFSSVVDKETIYKYYREEPTVPIIYYNKFYGNTYPTELSFNVLENPTGFKLFENLFLVGTKAVPDEVIYKLEDVEDEKVQLIIPYTNVAYDSGHVIDGIAGEYVLTTTSDMIYTQNQEPLSKGDLISVVDQFGLINYFTCMSYSASSKKIYIDKRLNLNISSTLTIGYRAPIRLANAAYEDGFAKVSCRIHEKNNPSKLSAPRGKWANIGLKYEGMSPLYLERAITTYTISNS